MKNIVLQTAVISLLFGCSSAGFEPRAIQSHPQPEAASSSSLAFARQQFRNGNYALAAQQFRQAIRQNPNDADAYNGLAACYDQMQRFDLSDRYYQQALALAPTDRSVRHNFALSLRMQGRVEEASAFDMETAALASQDASGAIPQETELAIAAAEPILVVPIRAVEIAPRNRAISLERMSTTEVALITSPTSDLARSISSRPIEIVENEAPVPSVARRDENGEREWRWSLRVPEPQQSLGQLAWQQIATAVRRLRQTEPAVAMVAASPGRNRTAVAAVAYPAIDVRETDNGRQWSWRLSQETNANLSPSARVRVLNGVGRRGQAARMRRHLRTLGATTVSIGDARHRREHTVIAYPGGARAEAERLAAALPFASRLSARANVNRVTLVLGRDAIGFDQQLQARFIAL